MPSDPQIIGDLLVKIFHTPATVLQPDGTWKTVLPEPCPPDEEIKADAERIFPTLPAGQSFAVPVLNPLLDTMGVRGGDHYRRRLRHNLILAGLRQSVQAMKRS